MTPTTVGMRCPECAGQSTRVHRAPRRRPGALAYTPPFEWNNPRTWTATQILIAINVVLFLWEVFTGLTLGGNNAGSSWPWQHGVLFGAALTSNNPNPAPFNGTHEYWRLVTSGFLHESILHIGMNMISLWFVGRSLEPAIGRAYFTGIYLTALLAGSFGALVFETQVPTLGASGAIFGIFGALIAIAHARRIPLWQSGLLPILILNFVYTLTVPGVALGGHVGGVVCGLICGRVVVEFGEKRQRPPLVYACFITIAVLCVAGSLLVAGGNGIAPNGWTL